MYFGKKSRNWSAIYPGFEILISTSSKSVIFADGVLNANEQQYKCFE